MAETTQLVMAGKRMSMPRLAKRLVQMTIAVGLTAAVIFVVIVGNGFLVPSGRASTVQAGFNAWLGFVRRPEILTTMVLTALVTVLLVYWQRDKERKVGGGRPSATAGRRHRLALPPVGSVASSGTPDVAVAFTT